MSANTKAPLTQAEMEVAEKQAEIEWRKKWAADQSLRAQYGGLEERFLANQRARLRASMLTRGMHTRGGT